MTGKQCSVSRKHKMRSINLRQNPVRVTGEQWAWLSLMHRVNKVKTVNLNVTEWIQGTQCWTICMVQYLIIIQGAWDSQSLWGQWIRDLRRLHFRHNLTYPGSTYICILMKGFSLGGVATQPSFQNTNGIDCNHDRCVCAVKCNCLDVKIAHLKRFPLGKA